MKLMKMNAYQGYVLLNNEPEAFKKKIDELSYMEGVYKLKINPYNGVVYYNIIDMYKKDSGMMLKKEYWDFKEVFRKY